MAQNGIDLYLTDIHGEYETFSHVLRSGCGAVNRAADALFADRLAQDERDELATLVCYPAAKIELLGTERAERLRPYAAELCRYFGGDDGLAHSLEELCLAVQRLAVKRLFMLGDVYDRGPAPDLVADELMAFPATTLVWGNHDILWMGAALGQLGCICTVVRICARYGNLSVLEDTYGIDLAPLSEFALAAYSGDPCAAFGLKGGCLEGAALERHVKVQKAMAIIQFKVEAHLIDENPSFDLEKRKLLHRIDHERGTVEIEGVEHELLDRVLPTVDAADPYALTPAEQRVVEYLASAFAACKKLQDHMDYFLRKGSMYALEGDDLLIHACVPLEEDGSLKQVELFGERVAGKALYDAVDAHIRAAASSADADARKRGLDLIWYLWLGEGSPLFAKSKMATFELYFVADKAARKEVKNAFYSKLDDADAMRVIFEDFGINPERGTILCGHVPVKVASGEDPVKAGGKLVDLDGGMSKPYRSKSGVAGMALYDDGNCKTLAYLEPLPARAELVSSNAVLRFDARQL